MRSLIWVCILSIALVLNLSFAFADDFDRIDINGQVFVANDLLPDEGRSDLQSRTLNIPAENTFRNDTENRNQIVGVLNISAAALSSDHTSLLIQPSPEHLEDFYPYGEDSDPYRLNTIPIDPDNENSAQIIQIDQPNRRAEPMRLLASFLSENEDFRIVLSTSTPLQRETSLVLNAHSREYDEESGPLTLHSRHLALAKVNEDGTATIFYAPFALSNLESAEEMQAYLNMILERLDRLPEVSMSDR